MTKPTRKFNPDWPSAKADTPERKAAAQRKRYTRMKAKAKELGYDSWAALVTAILDGKVKLVKNPPDSVG